MVAAALALGLAGVRGPASGRGTGAGVGVARAAPVLALAAAGVVVAAPATVRLAARLVRRPLALARGTVGRLAADNAARNPRRSALCASALAVGLIVVTYVLVLGAAEAAWRDARRAEPPLSGDGVDLVVYAPASAPPGLVEAIAARPEVGAVTGARETVVLVDDVPGLLVGVRPEAAADLWDYEVVAGSLADVTPAAEPALPGVAISARQAEEGGLTVGDEVSAVFPSVGPVSLRVAALFTGNRPVAGGGERFLADPMLVDTAVVAEHDPDGWSGEVSVGLASGVSTEEGRAAVRETVAAADTGPLDVVVATPEERAAQLDDGASDDTLDQLESTIDALLALAVVVALVGVVNAQVLSTVERSREIGLLRAVGATRAQVRAAVRWETVVVGLLGTVLALAVGVPLALVLVEGQRPALPTVVPVRALAVVAALTLAATFVASLVPAWWSARHISPRPDDTR